MAAGGGQMLRTARPYIPRAARPPNMEEMEATLDVNGGLYGRFVAWQWALCAIHYFAAAAVVFLLVTPYGDDWAVPVQPYPGAPSPFTE
jgi:hypothetical protein